MSGKKQTSTEIKVVLLFHHLTNKTKTRQIALVLPEEQENQDIPPLYP